MVQQDIVIIGVYGFLKNFCPDGFYMSNILLGPHKNFTVAEATQDVYPMLAYSNMLLILVALLVTDVLQYKTVIIIGALASVMTKVVLLWGNTVLHMQMVQLLYAVYRASQVAYRTYIYTKVQKHSYQRVTAVVHITPKLGTLVSAVASQLIVSSQLCNLDYLIVISICGLFLSFVVSLTLPSVEGTAYCPDPTESTEGRYRHATRLLWAEFVSASTSLSVVQWCVWWILATGAMQLVSDYYVQALWNDISGETQSTFNAGVEAVYAVTSSLVCYMIGQLQVDWKLHGNMIFALCTIVKGLGLLVCSHTRNMLIAYVLYVTVSVLYDMMMVISNSQVALRVKNDSFGLIFGINTFLSLVFQSILTYVLTSKTGFALPIRLQFEAIGYFLFALGFGFSMKCVYNACCTMQDEKKTKQAQTSDNQIKIILDNQTNGHVFIVNTSDNCS